MIDIVFYISYGYKTLDIFKDLFYIFSFKPIFYGYLTVIAVIKFGSCLVQNLDEF